MRRFRCGLLCAVIVALVVCCVFISDNDLFETPANRLKRNIDQLIQCCGDGFPQNRFTFLKSERTECTLSVKEDDADVKVIIEKYACFMDCFGKTNEMMVNGKLNKAKIMELTQVMDKDEYRLIFYGKNFDKCAKEAKEIQENVKFLFVYNVN